MATLCTCCQRICLYYGDMLRWREPERGPSSQSCESQGRAAPVRVPGTVPIANSGGIAPNALSPRQSKNKLLHIENAATYSITYTTIPRTQRPPFSLVSTHTQALTRQRAAVASSSMAFRKILPNNATFGERLHDMKGCPLLDVQISRTGLKNAAAYTTGLHPFTPALPPQTALATTGGRKLSNDSTPQNFTLQHAGGRPSTVDYEQLAPSAFPSAQAPIAATVHSNPKADFAVDGTHGILTDRLSNIQQQVGAQPLSFRNVQQVEQATQEPDASTTSSSSSIPLPADNITTTRQSASGVRPATSSSTSIAFSMATGNSSFMQTTKQGPIDTDGLLTFRHGGMLACTYSNSNMILPPAYATTMMWGTSAPTLARTLKSTSTLAIWSFTLTNSSSLERPATPPFLATAPDHLPVYLLLSAILTLRSLSYLYEAGKPISGLTYTPRNATPTKLNVTKKRKTNQRTGLLEKAKGVQNSMKALKQRLQDKYVMQCQTRLQMEMEHPGAFAAHYLKRAIAKQVRRCIQRSNGYHIQRLSQVVNGPGSRTGLYFRVVGTHVLGVVPSFYSCRLSHGVLVRFLRFRLGCHHLRIHTGRWLPPLLPHSQRTCLRCSSTVVDDEAHCLFMCEHPTIVEARDLFLAAVVPPVAALSSLRYADFWALSATGCVPLSALVKYVAVCVRVCWYCHQSGGTDVVDLPDILLPAGQYLDMFDSESETDVPSDSSDEELVEV